MEKIHFLQWIHNDAFVNVISRIDLIDSVYRKEIFRYSYLDLVYYITRLLKEAKHTCLLNETYTFELFLVFFVTMSQGLLL